MLKTRMNKGKTRISAGFSLAEMEGFEPYKNGLNKRNNLITVLFLRHQVFPSRCSASILEYAYIHP